MKLNKFKKRKWRVWFRVIHRDLGFLIFSLSIIYSISGITLNHINDWNPSYNVLDDKIELSSEDLNLNSKELIEKLPHNLKYKKSLDKEYGKRIFVSGGTVDVVNSTKIAHLEVLKRKAIFYEFNYLHYNRNNLWIWFSDVFAILLIIVSISGLFIVKGKYGITKYGAIWISIGVLVPSIFLLLVL